MIRSFRCGETEKIFRREFSRKFPGDIQERAFMKLNAVDAAVDIQDLRFPPSSRLEALKGNRKGQLSIRINNQWRICFKWLDGHAEDVAIEDYHYRRCGMVKKRIPPVHPGAYLKELLDELGLSQYRLAKDIGIPAMRVSYVVKGKRPITAELALRLGRYFGQNPRYWLNLQSRYDMDIVEDTLSDQVARQVRPRAIAVS